MNKKFIVYIPAGYPDIQFTKKILEMLNQLPVTGIEIGVPFSDPIADGEVIQIAHQTALKNNINLDIIFNLLKKIKLNSQLFIMSYLNPIINYPFGVKKFLKNLYDCNIKSLIIPDLPNKEIKNLNLNFPIIPFAAPNTNEEEIKIINLLKPEFVYYIARYGITGERKDLPFKDKIKYLKTKINAPICIGFGISTKEQVIEAFKIADGVIVGSTIVKELHTKNLKRIEKKILNLIP